MLANGSRRRAVGSVAIGAVLALIASSMVWASPSTDASAAGGATQTLTVSLPGPFNGCSYLDAGATPTSNAILDLVRPSAFLTAVDGSLVGAQGPIASAELTSLTPETVVYTINPKEFWSNGQPFDGRDLVAWWLRARGLASVVSDGYRSIKSMTLSNHALTVTAVFAKPYADWDLLFRDVESRTSASGCAIANLMRRPSLGPYRVVSATPQTIVLALNPSWPSDVTRFGRVVLRADASLPSDANAPFASYSLTVDRSQVESLGAHPAVLSHIGSASAIEELVFNSQRPLTKALPLREALSWSLDRQAMITALWGLVTFSPSVAASAIYAQGEVNYPGSSGQAPSESTTTTTVPPATSTTPTLADCVVCATRTLRKAGYVKTALGWVTPSGQPVAIRLVTGPSALDHATASLVVRQWAQFGVSTYVVGAASESLAATSLAYNNADVAIFTRPTMGVPSYTARSWTGPPYPDSYPSGLRLASLDRIFASAMNIFNPVTASTVWTNFDQILMTSFWVRPLFTPPSLIEWTPIMQGVLPSESIPGFVDEVPSWNTVATVTPPSS